MSLQALIAEGPRVVGPYELRGRLGAGGMGVVYLGFSSAGQPVAVKTLPAGVGVEFRRGLNREAELLSAVTHPRVAHFVSADVAADRPWLAMQYVSGPSLADVTVPLTSAPLRQLTDGLAEALAALHRQGLTHRDVKPGNIILTYDGPILVDLGIASSPELTSLTAYGTTVGTPAWMAPEQLAGHPAVHATDVWGWACVAVYAATGSPPFGHGPVAALAHRIRYEAPQLGALPDWLRGPVQAALAKDPALRPSVAQLGTSAQSASPTLVESVGAAPTRALDTSRTSATRRRRWIPAVATAAALAMGGVATAIILNSGPTSAGTGAVAGSRTADTTPTAPSHRTTGSLSTAPSTQSTTSFSSSAQPQSSTPPTITTALLRRLGACAHPCAITGEIAFEHPVWGPSTLVSTMPSADGTVMGTGHLIALDAAGHDKWDVTLPRLYSLMPAPTASDASGHLFLNYNPGRYNGVIVLDPTGGGFDDFRSLPLPDDPSAWRFYSATVTDTDHDGTFEIDRALNDCTPDCASGSIRHTIYRWNGTSYTPR